METIEHSAKIIKVDEALGVVFGWAMVSTVKGEPYYDLQSDHIPDEVMLRASKQFMSSPRVAKEMHSGDRAGTIIFAMPMTADIAKAYGMQSDTSGLMIGFEPSDKAMLAKYASGEYKGFSIGGRALREAVG